MKSEAAMAARAEAERSEDARGGGSGGGLPSDTKDADDVGSIPPAGSSDTDDIADAAFLSVVCASDTEDLVDTVSSVNPSNETSDVDETIF